MGVIGRAKSDKSQNYQDAVKLINARISNLETNLHIEIDMERIEDRSKALSYIGIEVADALKLIPTPEETIVENVQEPCILVKMILSMMFAKFAEEKWKMVNHSFLILKTQ